MVMRSFNWHLKRGRVIVEFLALVVPPLLLVHPSANQTAHQYESQQKWHNERNQLRWGIWTGNCLRHSQPRSHLLPVLLIGHVNATQILSVVLLQQIRDRQNRPQYVLILSAKIRRHTNAHVSLKKIETQSSGSVSCNTIHLKLYLTSALFRRLFAFAPCHPPASPCTTRSHSSGPAGPSSRWTPHSRTEPRRLCSGVLCSVAHTLAAEPLGDCL